MVEILTVQELANILKLHPRTVMKMASDGDLPAAKVGRKWRFDRGRIESWLEARMKQPNGSASPELSTLQFPQLLSPEQVTIIEYSLSKNAILIQLASMVHPQAFGLDLEEFVELLQERESMFPTAMEYGVAFPHPRHPISNIKVPLLALAIVPKGVLFGAPGHQKTYVFVMICAPDDRTHVHLLAKLSRVFRSNGMVKELCQCNSAQQVLEAFLKTESTVLADQNI